MKSLRCPQRLVAPGMAVARPNGCSSSKRSGSRSRSSTSSNNSNNSINSRGSVDEAALGLFQRWAKWSDLAAAASSPKARCLGEGSFGSACLVQLSCPERIKRRVMKKFPGDIAVEQLLRDGLLVVVKTTPHAKHPHGAKAGEYAAVVEEFANVKVRGSRYVAHLLSAQHCSEGASYFAWLATAANPIDVDTVIETAKAAGQHVPMAFTLQVAKDLAAALTHCHTNGQLHNYVKPANVVVRCSVEGWQQQQQQQPLAYLVDFGMVTPLGGTILQHNLRGSQLFQDPQLRAEYAVSAGEVKSSTYTSSSSTNPFVMGPGCDIYSYGMTLLEIVSTGDRTAMGELKMELCEAYQLVQAKQLDASAVPLIIRNKLKDIPQAAATPELLEVIVACLDCQSNRISSGAQLQLQLDWVEQAEAERQAEQHSWHKAEVQEMLQMCLSPAPQQQQQQQQQSHYVQLHDKLQVLQAVPAMCPVAEQQQDSEEEAELLELVALLQHEGEVQEMLQMCLAVAQEQQQQQGQGTQQEQQQRQAPEDDAELQEMVQLCLAGSELEEMLKWCCQH